METNEENPIKARRNALKLSQKKLAKLVADESGKSFSYQALQKIEAGGESTLMHVLLTVLDREEQKRSIRGRADAAEISTGKLIDLAVRHQKFLQLFDSLSEHRRKYILNEVNEQLAKQREGPEKSSSGGMENAAS
jgi:hypothetical protein